MENAITRDQLTYTQSVPKKEQPLANSPLPCFTAEHKVLWDGISLSWGQLAWLCPFPDSHPDCVEWDTEKALALCWHSSTSAKLSLCYQHCLGHKSKPQHHMDHHEENQPCSSQNQYRPVRQTLWTTLERSGEDKVTPGDDERGQEKDKR